MRKGTRFIGFPAASTEPYVYREPNTGRKSSVDSKASTVMAIVFVVIGIVLFGLTR